LNFFFGYHFEHTSDVSLRQVSNTKFSDTLKEVWNRKKLNLLMIVTYLLDLVFEESFDRALLVKVSHLICDFDVNPLRGL